MAAEFRPFEYVFASTAPVQLSTIIGGRVFISDISVRAGKSNAMIVAIGGATVTQTSNRGGYLDPGEALSVDLVQKFFTSDQFYLAGSVGDRVHILSFA